MKKSFALATVLAAAALTLTACGGDSGGASARYNDADVTFAQSMIPHHEQAVEMAELADDQARSPEVKRLAADIEAAQGPEIEQMKQWLRDWGQDTSMDHGDMGHGDSMSDMPGMMDDADLRDLGQARGATWDRMFLTMMIAHHQGALVMARTEVADGTNPEAVALAKKIQEDQAAEISQMRQMLRS